LRISRSRLIFINASRKKFSSPIEAKFAIKLPPNAIKEGKTMKIAEANGALYER
jgi:hypothetical protein